MDDAQVTDILTRLGCDVKTILHILANSTKNEIEQLIKNNTTSPLLSFMGEPVVNVFMLNQALDKLSAEKQQKVSTQ
ncbi:hypothetical protein ABN09_11400 [Morganella morganii]|nr:hypothetical protein ABN09_11400 [Morganella morganii]